MNVGLIETPGLAKSRFKKTRRKCVLFDKSAEGGNRTHIPVRERNFESRASAYSATSARLQN